LFLFFSPLTAVWRVDERAFRFNTHALFGRRVRCHTASENAQPASRMIFRHVLFHMRRRVLSDDVWIRVNGRLNFPSHFSLLPAPDDVSKAVFYQSSFQSLNVLIIFSDPYFY